MKKNYAPLTNKFGQTLKSRPLTCEAEKELKYNSIERIEPFLKKLDQWYREMAISLRKNPFIDSSYAA